MKPALLLALALAVVSCGVASDPARERPLDRSGADFLLANPPRPSPTEKVRATLFPTETERAFELERRADLVLSYRRSGEMGIESISGKPTGQDDTPADLSGFLHRQRKKSLVVVIIEKQTWTEEELARHLTFLNRYFTDHGYRRVVIQQARGYGRPIHSDTARPGSSRPKHQRRWDR